MIRDKELTGHTWQRRYLTAIKPAYYVEDVAVIMDWNYDKARRIVAELKRIPNVMYPIPSTVFFDSKYVSFNLEDLKRAAFAEKELGIPMN